MGSVFLTLYNYIYIYLKAPLTFWRDFSHIPATILLAKFNLFILNSCSVVPLRFEALSVRAITITHPLILIQASCRIPMYTFDAELCGNPRWSLGTGLYLPFITCPLIKVTICISYLTYLLRTSILNFLLCRFFMSCLIFEKFKCTI